MNQVADDGSVELSILPIASIGLDGRIVAVPPEDMPPAPPLG
ncbi:hypothetical protein [Hymenobacter terrenus]|nr:hypothetical protein [Hymenobacter terrenus]